MGRSLAPGACLRQPGFESFPHACWELGNCWFRAILTAENGGRELARVTPRLNGYLSNANVDVQENPSPSEASQSAHSVIQTRFRSTQACACI